MLGLFLPERQHYIAVRSGFGFPFGVAALLFPREELLLNVP